MDARGLSLLEVVIATGILAIAIVAISFLSVGTTAGNVKSEDRTAALALATEKLEELKNTTFSSLTAGSESSIQADGTSGGIFNRSWTVSNATLYGSADRELAVTVSWNAGSVTLATRVVQVREEAPGFPVAALASWYQP